MPDAEEIDSHTTCTEAGGSRNAQIDWQIVGEAGVTEQTVVDLRRAASGA